MSDKFQLQKYFICSEHRHNPTHSILNNCLLLITLIGYVTDFNQNINGTMFKPNPSVHSTISRTTKHITNTFPEIKTTKQDAAFIAEPREVKHVLRYIARKSHHHCCQCQNRLCHSLVSGVTGCI